ncbi:hypothetical protein REJC140_03151 [Pseudorhizobium endolithicum]|uniref:Uncharacterized protein n=1 Tax=Pseudorhizobium endolithicum TaxID=1191678 RepID=A0ABM8PJ98_9HYPH|nr:hypothetical protein REQ54_01880 [Rhizobium sp. Q54]CAD7033174.1 hypothetical protein REJC140_03151 [Pseudorhizobium endolithicum]
MLRCPPAPPIWTSAAKAVPYNTKTEASSMATSATEKSQMLLASARAVSASAAAIEPGAIRRPAP